MKPKKTDKGHIAFMVVVVVMEVSVMTRAIIIVALALSMTGCAAIHETAKFHNTCNPLGVPEVKAICKAGAIGVGAAWLTLEGLVKLKEHSDATSDNAPKRAAQNNKLPADWTPARVWEFCKATQIPERFPQCQQLVGE